MAPIFSKAINCETETGYKTNESILILSLVDGPRPIICNSSPVLEATPLQLTEITILIWLRLELTKASNQQQNPVLKIIGTFSEISRLINHISTRITK